MSTLAQHVSIKTQKHGICLLMFSALELREDGLENETLTSHPATTLQEQYQVFIGVWSENICIFLCMNNFKAGLGYNMCGYAV